MYRSLTKNEITNRLTRFQDRLKIHGVDGAIIVQKVDLYYLSGTDQDAHLWVPALDSPLLMVRKSIERAKMDSPVEEIVPLPGFSHLPELIRQHTDKPPKRLGLEMDVLPAAIYQIYQRLFPDVELVDISSLIRDVRMTKSAYEISCIEGAVEMADHMYEKIPGFLAESGTETDLALRVEAFYRGEGHPGFVRTRAFNMGLNYGHIMAGPNAAMPSGSGGPTGGRGLGPFHSQGAGRGKIREKEPVVVDYTSNVEGYISDQTRIFSFGGVKEEFHHAHGVMLEVQERVSQMGRSGSRAGDLYDEAIKVVERAGLIEGFMGYPEPVPFVGHGVGLELDEWPVLARGSGTVIKEGMVIALEPKMVFPGQGVVGIENMFLVTNNGMKRLNRFPDAISILAKRDMKGHVV